MAVYNTQLLYTYSLIDDRFKEMVALVKHWAKNRYINDTYSGTLSSYAYVVMVIHFMQYACHPPILPPLQTLGFKPGDARKMLTVDEQVYDVDFFRNVGMLSEVWPHTGRNRNRDSIGRIFYLFLHYWAHEFDFRNHVACIRTGGLLTKDAKEWVPLIEKKKREESGEGEDGGDGGKEREGNGDIDAASSEPLPVDGDRKSSDARDSSTAQESLSTGKPFSTTLGDTAELPDSATATQDLTKPKLRLQRYWICIEDPFETTHNLGRPVGRDSLYFIRGEFLQAVKHMQNTRNYPRNYIQDLRERRRIHHPDILSLVCKESPYQTREEHKERNRENMSRKKPS